MFEALAQAVGEMEIPADSAAIAKAIELRSRLDARIAEAVGAFDRASLWHLDAATSMTAWLKDHGMSRRDAARATTVARRLAALPVTAGAWRDGALSAGQIDVILST